MAKKKKDPSLIYQIDECLDEKYKNLLEEITFMQADIDRAERKARKKALKEMKKGNTFYDMNIETRVRRDVIRNMEGSDFLTRCMNVLEELKPVCMIIARLVMALIVSILSISSVGYRIKPDTLNKMHSVYNMAHKIAC